MPGHDPQFLYQWLMESPTTTVECPVCRGKWGRWEVRVGINLTKQFNAEEAEWMIDAVPVVSFGNHRCALAESEVMWVNDEAIKWAKLSFAKAEREWERTRYMLTEPGVIDA